MKNRLLAGMLLIASMVSGCASDGSGGPATRKVVNGYIANPEGLGFRVLQHGSAVVPVYDGGYLVFQLKKEPFTFSLDYPQLSIYLSEKDTGEIRVSNGLQIDCLSGALSGASSPDSSQLFIANYQDRFSSNNALVEAHGLKKTADGHYSYVVESFLFLKDRQNLALDAFSGVLFGYAWIDYDGDRKIGLDEVARVKLVVAE